MFSRGIQLQHVAWRFCCAVLFLSPSFWETMLIYVAQGTVWPREVSLTPEWYLPPNSLLFSQDNISFQQRSGLITTSGVQGGLITTSGTQGGGLITTSGVQGGESNIDGEFASHVCGKQHTGLVSATNTVVRVSIDQNVSF